MKFCISFGDVKIRYPEWLLPELAAAIFVLPLSVFVLPLLRVKIDGI